MRRTSCPLLMAPCSWTDCFAPLERAISVRVGQEDRPPNAPYSALYALLVLPALQHVPPTRSAKLLEIGFGCGMPFGEGNGIMHWRAVLPSADLWSAEIDQACVERWRRRFRGEHPQSKPPFQSLYGDQSNTTVLASWVQNSGGEFDVVIDDGSHINSHILLSFTALWPHVNPGGLYVMEDLGVGRSKVMDDTNGGMVMADIIRDWIAQLLVPRDAHTRVHPPDDLAFITCVSSACALAKSRFAWSAPQRKAIAQKLAQDLRGTGSSSARPNATVKRAILYEAMRALNKSHKAASFETAIRTALDDEDNPNPLDYRPSYRRQ